MHHVVFGMTWEAPIEIRLRIALHYVKNRFKKSFLLKFKPNCQFSHLNVLTQQVLWLKMVVLPVWMVS